MKHRFFIKDCVVVNGEPFIVVGNNLLRSAGTLITDYDGLLLPKDERRSPPSKAALDATIAQADFINGVKKVRNVTQS